LDRIRQAEIGPSLINIQSNPLVDYLNYQRQVRNGEPIA